MNSIHQNLFRTKICGITRGEDFLAAVDAGAEAIGFNFYLKGKRYVAPSTVAKIVEANREDVSNLDFRPKLIGVFVNASHQSIVEIADELRLDGIQLHGDEDPQSVSQLRNDIGSSTLILRAVRTQAETDSLAPTQQEIDLWVELGVDVILLDASSPDAYGGTGKQLNWNNVDQLNISVPWILAGGLKPNNVGEAIRVAKPHGVDTASGVEVSPGVKDKSLVQSFVDNARKAFP